MKTYTEKKTVRSPANIDKAMKALASKCKLASETIKHRVDEYEERGKEMRKKRHRKQFLHQYADEIPLAKASLDNISIEEAAMKIDEAKFKAKHMAG